MAGLHISCANALYSPCPVSLTGGADDGRGADGGPGTDDDADGAAEAGVIGGGSCTPSLWARLMASTFDTFDCCWIDCCSAGTMPASDVSDCMATGRKCFTVSPSDWLPPAAAVCCCCCCSSGDSAS